MSAWAAGALMGSLFFNAVAVADTLQLEIGAGADAYSNHGTNDPNGGWSATGVGGGEFRVYKFEGMDIAPMAAIAKLPGSMFQTFCIEYSEHFSPGSTYNWTLNTAATGGGLSGQDGPGSDSLDERTAYLYTQFYKGLLNYDYDYTLNPALHKRAHDSLALQIAFWFIEGELNADLLAKYNGGVNADYVQAKAWVTQATNAVNSGAWSGLGQVRILNLYSFSGRTRIENQDQLVMVVPLPLSAYLGLGLIGAMGALRIVRRRRISILS